MTKISHEKIAKTIRSLINDIGEDTNRPGLKETPERVARAWTEWTKGYQPPAFSVKLFPTKFDGLIVRQGIPFTSTCEHHLLSYIGTVDFGYVSNKKIIGISKIVRLIQHYASRLTIQEDLTVDLLRHFDQLLKPKGIIIKITAIHSCESTRGISIPNIPTITLLYNGVFKKDDNLVEQFHQLIGNK